MKVRFFASDKKREQKLGEAFCNGVKKWGDEARLTISQPVENDWDFDVGVVFGVKSKLLYDNLKSRGKVVIMMDKGYTRGRIQSNGLWPYMRVSVNAHHPTHYLMDYRFPSDRLEQLNLEIRPWRKEGDFLLFAGSSQKYHDFYNLGRAQEYAEHIVDMCRGHEWPLIYRPKPSWKDAGPIEGSRYSPPRERLIDILPRCHALITHGSNACFEAILHGVPCVILGNAIAAPISSTKFNEIDNPLVVSEEKRYQWLSNVAYCQWALEEFNDGKAWLYLRRQVEADQ